VDSKKNLADSEPAEEPTGDGFERPGDAPDTSTGGGTEKNGIQRVGYKSPPLHTRFRPGRSGNAKGRPRGASNLRTYVDKEWKEKIVVREGQRTRKISKGQAVVKKTFNDAISGKGRATDRISNWLERMGHLDAGTSDTSQPSAEEDEMVLELLKSKVSKQIRGSKPTDEEGPEGAQS